MVQEQLGVKVLQLLKLVKTRWLSRGMATARIEERHASLVIEFEEDAGGKTKSTTTTSLVDITTSHKFIAALTCFAHILMLLTAVSRMFQAVHVRHGEARTIIAATKAKCAA